jgi:glycosyltransferase involved in cell wall biosynthesis
MKNMAMFAAKVWRGVGTKQLGKPDVIIGSSPHLFGALAAERVSRRLKVPFVLEVRDLWPQTLIDLGSVSAGHPVIKGLERIERYLYKHAERIITLLPQAREHMMTKGAAGDKVVWIPNGVKLEAQTPAALPTGGVFTVMYAGTHGLANGLDAILDAAAILQRDPVARGVRFHFVGDGPFKERLQVRCEQEGLANVVFDAPVPKGHVFGTLQRADAFIVTLRDIPLYRHGISLNKIFDYFAAARPIVFGTNDGNNPVSEARAGVVVRAEDAPAMAEAIKHLLSLTPEERYQMGLRGRRYVQEHHASTHLAQKLEEVLKGAASVSKQSTFRRMRGAVGSRLRSEQE